MTAAPTPSPSTPPSARGEAAAPVALPPIPNAPAPLTPWAIAKERRKREQQLDGLEQERRQVARLLDDTFLVLGTAMRAAGGTDGPAADAELQRQLADARAQHTALTTQLAALHRREAALQQETARLATAQDVESARRRLQVAQEAQRLAADVASTGTAVSSAAQHVKALEAQLFQHQQTAEVAGRDERTRAMKAGWEAFASGRTEGLDADTVKAARTLLQRHQGLDGAIAQAQGALSTLPQVSRLAYAVGILALALSLPLALVGLAYGQKGAPVLWGSLAAASAVHLLPRGTPGWGLTRLMAWPVVFFWWGVTVETGFRLEAFPTRTVVSVAVSAALLLAVFLRQRAQGHSPGPWGAIGLVVCTLLVPLHAQGVLEGRRADKTRKEARIAASAALSQAEAEARRKETLADYGAYLARAQEALTGGRLDDARELLFRLREVRPGDAGVAELGQQLERLETAEREQTRRKSSPIPVVSACAS